MVCHHPNRGVMEHTPGAKEPLVASLLLVVRPGAPSSFKPQRFLRFHLPEVPHILRTDMLSCLVQHEDDEIYP